jgi:hypothetical protein
MLDEIPGGRDVTVEQLFQRAVGASKLARDEFWAQQAGASGEGRHKLEEARNTRLCHSQEKFHTVVLHGVGNISDTL